VKTVWGFDFGVGVWGLVECPNRVHHRFTIDDSRLTFSAVSGINFQLNGLHLQDLNQILCQELSYFLPCYLRHATTIHKAPQIKTIRLLQQQKRQHHGQKKMKTIFFMNVSRQARGNMERIRLIACAIVH
jgi:hypothetical protein